LPFPQTATAARYAIGSTRNCTRVAIANTQTNGTTTAVRRDGALSEYASAATPPTKTGYASASELPVQQLVVEDGRRHVSQRLPRVVRGGGNEEEREREAARERAQQRD
jgi:hypothetical protein